MPNKTEYKSIIALLDDPDEEIYENIFNRLCEYGPAIIPELEQEWEHSPNAVVQERLENLLHTIQFDFVKAELKTWSLTNSEDLLAALILINKYKYPDADLNEIHNQLQKIKKTIWLELNANITPLEQIKIFNFIFYTIFSYKGNTEKPMDENAFYLNNLITSKSGNIISISLLYLLVAQQLHLPIYGVCLKDHFVLCYIDTEIFQSSATRINSQDVLFYINPFNNGAIFKREQIKTYIENQKLKHENKYFYPAENSDIIKEYLHYMILQYSFLKDEATVAELHILRNLL